MSEIGESRRVRKCYAMQIDYRYYANTVLMNVRQQFTIPFISSSLYSYFPWHPP